MTNLGQTCPFSNLILLYLFNGVGFGLVSWEQSFFDWFQGRNLLGDDQNFKRGGEVKKGENQISRGELFFLFCQSKLLSHFVPVFPDPTLNERSLKLMTVFTLVALNARRILKYLTTDHVFQTLILLPSPCVNTV